MSNSINIIAQQLKAPGWWLEGLAIEYLPCRVFGSGDTIWSFNFERVTIDQIKKLTEHYRIVQYGWLVHNVRSEVFKARILRTLSSPVALNLVDDITDVLPEGIVSESYFSFLSNPIDVWDPKLGFDSYCQAYDDGKVYQWKVAEFITVEGRGYGKWVSDFVNLEPLDQIHDKYAQLVRQKVPEGDPRFSEFVNNVIEFYEWISQLRHPIFAELEKLHQLWKITKLNLQKASIQEPPILSYFEKFKVANQKLYTLAIISPLFFRACVQHCRKSEALLSEMQADKNDVHKLDQLYQEQVEALISATACLEAFVNTLGFERFDSLWPSLERLSVEAKIQMLFHLSGKGDKFDSSVQPYQTLTKIVKMRNTLIHFKTRYEKIVTMTSSSETNLRHILNQQVLSTLPTRLKQLIEATCSECAFQRPPWIDNHSEWDV